MPLQGQFLKCRPCLEACQAAHCDSLLLKALPLNLHCQWFCSKLSARRRERNQGECTAAGQWVCSVPAAERHGQGMKVLDEREKEGKCPEVLC